MNVHDIAHQLARALCQSDEGRELAELRKKLEAEPSVKSMIEDFQKKRWEIEQRRLAGEPVEELETGLQKLAEVVGLNTLARDYLSAEYRFSVILSDVQRILGDAVGELAGSPSDS